MSIHIHANLVTGNGIAANNRGENEGNTTTLHKIVWRGAIHTSVSAEAIRFDIRRRLADFEPTNRTWNEEMRRNEWQDQEFIKEFIDDDVLGFMSAKAAGTEKEEEEQDKDNSKKKGKKKGTCTARRGPLEVARAISLTPWTGDVIFNAASPGASPAAAKKGDFSVPYAAEVHATRYQYGITLTPQSLRNPKRTEAVLNALRNLSTVAGNHGRYLYDFSPEAVVFRITQDPAPRILYCFDTEDGAKTISAHGLLGKIAGGDIDKKELVLGVSHLESELAKAFMDAGVKVMGVKAAFAEAAQAGGTR